MALIYKATCSRCGYERRTTDGNVAIIAEGNHSAYADKEYPELVHLIHPGEGRILEELGTDCCLASRQGKYVIVKNLFCKTCGMLYQSRSISHCETTFGCFVIFLLSVALAFITYAYGLHWIIAILVG
jgi:predicted Zn-ribbon and HTH transcriptional regulator